MERRIGKRAWERDCCTRVFKRSAGWRRMELQRPEARPARKWKVGCACFVNGGFVWPVLGLGLMLALEIVLEPAATDEEARGSRGMLSSSPPPL